MKYLKTFESFNKSLDVTTDADGFKIMNFKHRSDLEFMENRFYRGKEWIAKDGDFDIYLYEDKDYDKNEDEYVWYKKTVIYIDYKNLIYKTKVLESKPLLNIRDANKGMTIRQEQLVRSYAGTDKNPKHPGKYLGMEDGFALVKSQYSDAIYKIDKNGDMYDIKTGHKLGE